MNNEPVAWAGVGNGNSKYSERIKTIKNDGEYLFEKYCNEKKYNFYRLGFDEHKKNVDKYWRLNKFLRNLPDYIVNTTTKTFVVSVKGTDNFKQKEFTMMPELAKFLNSEEAPWIYAFCFKEQKSPICLYPKQIVELYEKGTDEKWHDGVIYRNLNIRKKK